MNLSAKQAKEQFLAEIKAEGRSSPAGIHWQELCDFLRKRAGPGGSKLPAPLILAASGASDHAKHCRLGEQLDWAIENGLLQDALDFLRGISAEHWNSGTPNRWHTEYWP